MRRCPKCKERYDDFGEGEIERDELFFMTQVAAEFESLYELV